MSNYRGRGRGRGGGGFGSGGGYAQQPHPAYYGAQLTGWGEPQQQPLQNDYYTQQPQPFDFYAQQQQQQHDFYAQQQQQNVAAAAQFFSQEQTAAFPGPDGNPVYLPILGWLPDGTPNFEPAAMNAALMQLCAAGFLPSMQELGGGVGAAPRTPTLHAEPEEAQEGGDPAEYAAMLRSQGLREGTKAWDEGMRELRDCDRLLSLEASLKAEGLTEGSPEWEDRVYAFEQLLEDEGRDGSKGASPRRGEESVAGGAGGGGGDSGLGVALGRRDSNDNSLTAAAVDGGEEDVEALLGRMQLLSTGGP